MEPVVIGYGETVRMARESRGWTQEDLASHSGVPRRTIQEIENGRVSKPQRSTDAKLRQALGDLAAVGPVAEWPEDVQAILEVVGDALVAIPPAERILWFADFMREEWKS